MLTLGHYQFQQRLKSKAELVGKRVFVVCEKYTTTQGCTNCGKRRLVGGQKTYSCRHCSVVLERDVNGARNIWLKNIAGVLCAYCA